MKASQIDKRIQPLGHSENRQDELPAGSGNLEETRKETDMAKQACLQRVHGFVEDWWQSLQNDSQGNAKEVAKRACDLAHPAGQTREP
jgi:hypothetical protein